MEDVVLKWLAANVELSWIPDRATKIMMDDDTEVMFTSRELRPNESVSTSNFYPHDRDLEPVPHYVVHSIDSPPKRYTIEELYEAKGELHGVNKKPMNVELEGKTQQITFDIEIPNGYEYVRFGVPEVGEVYMYPHLEQMFTYEQGQPPFKVAVFRKELPKTIKIEAELTLHQASTLVHLCNASADSKVKLFEDVRGVSDRDGALELFQGEGLWSKLGAPVMESLEDIVGIDCTNNPLDFVRAVKPLK